MSKIKVLIVEGLENGLYLINFLLYLAKTKSRRLIAGTSVNRIEY